MAQTPRPAKRRRPSVTRLSPSAEKPPKSTCFAQIPISAIAEHLYSANMSAQRKIPANPTAPRGEIARTAAHLDPATHHLLTCIRAFDASEEWGRQGTLNCAHWLSWRLRLGPVR
jgi:hypothetical protein